MVQRLRQGVANKPRSPQVLLLYYFGPLCLVTAGEFVETEDQVFGYDLIMSAISEEVEPLFV